MGHRWSGCGLGAADNVNFEDGWNAHQLHP
jgi:hypothetical protein